MTLRIKTVWASLLIVSMVPIMTCRAVCAETVVLAAANTQPTAFLVDGKPAGMLVDLVTEAFRRAGHPVEIKLMPWARCLKEAKTGEVDGVFSSFKLPERTQFLAFSKEVLNTQVIVFFARRDSTLSFDGDMNSVRDVKIGIINGTSYGTKFDTAVKDNVLRQVDQTDSIDSNVQKLALGRVDLIVSYRDVAIDAAKRLDLFQKIKEVSPPLEMVPSYLAFTKVRDFSKLSDAFDAELALMKQDGTYDRTIGKYRPLLSTPTTR